MENFKFQYQTRTAARGSSSVTLVGVVASGNLEVLLERHLNATECTVEVVTPIKGFEHIWQAVIDDFVERASPGGLRISINDGGARPDTVILRLLQGMWITENSHD